MRQAIVDRRQAEIDAWNSQIEQLVQARDQGMEQLQRLREATQSNRENLLQQTDNTFQDLADRLHKLVESNT